MRRRAAFLSLALLAAWSSAAAPVEEVAALTAQMEARRKAADR